MAPTFPALPRHPDDLDDTLSDEQVQQLLQDAGKRLKTAAAVLGAVAPPSNEATHVMQPSSNRPLATLNPGIVPRPYVSEKEGVARIDSASLVDEEQKRLSNTPRGVKDSVRRRIKVEKDKKATAGSDWFDLPRTITTHELKKDLQLLRMRPVLDPKRHYKKEGGKAKLPEFSHVGTVIEGPTEFYSARIPKKERKRTFVDETLAYEEESGRFKAKYEDIQVAKSSGKKAHYKALMGKRKRPQR